VVVTPCTAGALAAACAAAAAAAATALAAATAAGEGGGRISGDTPGHGGDGSLRGEGRVRARSRAGNAFPPRGGARRLLRAKHTAQSVAHSAQSAAAPPPSATAASTVEEKPIPARTPLSAPPPPPPPVAVDVELRELGAPPPPLAVAVSASGARGRCEEPTVPVGSGVTESEADAEADWEAAGEGDAGGEAEGERDAAGDDERTPLRVGDAVPPAARALRLATRESTGESLGEPTGDVPTVAVGAPLGGAAPDCSDEKEGEGAALPDCEALVERVSDMEEEGLPETRALPDGGADPLAVRVIEWLRVPLHVGGGEALALREALMVREGSAEALPLGGAEGEFVRLPRPDADALPLFVPLRRALQLEVSVPEGGAALSVAGSAEGVAGHVPK
jgi:hypothetical protein